MSGYCVQCGQTGGCDCMTPTDAARVAEIAAGLTKPLALALSELGDQPELRSVRWLARYGYRLERLGLADRRLLTDRSYATPLGIAVKNHLQSRSREKPE